MKTRRKRVGASAPVAIDLFAGAGGLAEGLISAGIHVAASVELHPQAGLTHSFNHPHTSVLIGDIRDLDLAVLDDAVSAAAGHNKVDLVVGGPPCQGFSSAGRKSLGDPRNTLFRHYLRVIEHARPPMFLMENVPGFKRMYQGRLFGEARAAFHKLGYETRDDIVAAAAFGVPQRRKRFVMVGWLPGEAVDFEWPKPTHSEATTPTLFGASSGYVTAGEALDDTAFLAPGFEASRYESDASSAFAIARRGGNALLFNHLATRHRAKALAIFRQIPVGGSIRSIPPELRGTKKLTMTRLDPGSVSNTIVSLPDDLLHYAHDRILTVRECARLQTFDDDFVFIGKRTSGFVERRVDVPQYTQVGNAVPPLLGRALGGSLLRSLGGRPRDLRDLEMRRQRHALVAGSSGYAGYTLTPNAKGELVLRTVRGEILNLPISDSDVPVVDQEPLRDWTLAPNPRRGQWAPGVDPKDKPAWVG